MHYYIYKAIGYGMVSKKPMIFKSMLLTPI